MQFACLISTTTQLQKYQLIRKEKPLFDSFLLCHRRLSYPLHVTATNCFIVSQTMLLAVSAESVVISPNWLLKWQYTVSLDHVA